MRAAYGLLLGFSLASQLAACDKVRAVVCEPVKAAPPAAAAEPHEKKPADAGAAAEQAPSPEDEPKAEEHEVAEADPHDKAAPHGALLTAHQGSRHQGAFALPFAWEKSPDEPLAKARTFLREVADDNTTYMAKGAAFFQPFAGNESPRATVVTCSDSRLQAGAFDASPENDVFMVRNIGNQVDNGLGSIEYGVMQLHTPVLLILGHTGCTAVKAAIGDTRGLAEPIQRELAGLHLAKKGTVDDRKWSDAVLENVHDQVKIALRQFSAEVNTGALTIVGAVYDVRNDLGFGAGKLSVIDVNGVQDAARLKAFGDAIMSGPGGKRAASDDPMLRLVKALADQGAFEEPEAEAEEEAQ